MRITGKMLIPRTAQTGFFERITNCQDGSKQATLDQLGFVIKREKAKRKGERSKRSEVE
jgi:hypothetical protein